MVIRNQNLLIQDIISYAVALNIIYVSSDYSSDINLN